MIAQELREVLTVLPLDVREELRACAENLEAADPNDGNSPSLAGAYQSLALQQEVLRCLLSHVIRLSVAAHEPCAGCGL